MTERLLAFDTSGFSCSAALWRGGSVVASRFEAMERGQAERLMPMLEAVMTQAGERYDALDLIAVTRGPGAFTGLRLGLATARALSLAASCPLLGVTVFEAVYQSLRPEDYVRREVLVAVESKREDLYLQLFGPAGPLGEPLALLPTAVAERFAGRSLLVAGNGAARLAAALPPDDLEISDVTEARAEGFASWAAAQPLPALLEKPQPLYMRPPDVSFPKARSR